LISLPVGLKYTDESGNFKFELRIDGRSVAECVEAADRFESTGGKCDFGGAKISGGAFEGVCHPLDGDRVGIGERPSNVSEHSLVPIEKQADELGE
jgi:hypothetical protein